MFSILKAVIELNNIGVMKSFMEFDLVCKSESSSVRSEFIFKNYFGGCFLFRLCILGDIAVGEPSFSKKSAFEVPSDDLCPINSSDVLIDDVGLFLFALTVGSASWASMFADTHLNFYRKSME